MHRTLLFATTNDNKAKEVRAAMKAAKLPLQVITDADLVDPPIVAETGHSFQANAVLKAHALAAFSHLPTLADDSGLVVPALGGEPGVHSARYAADHDAAANNRKLLARMQGLQENKRGAAFKTVMVLSWPGKFNRDLIVSGTAQGVILRKLQGPQTFGYDPLFYVPQAQKTFAQMSTAEKNSLSHRGRAVAALIKRLPGWWRQF